jgi:hypothetical protein
MGYILTKDKLIEIGRDLGVRLPRKSWDETFSILYDAVEYDMLIKRLIQEVEDRLRTEERLLEKYPN